MYLDHEVQDYNSILVRDYLKKVNHLSLHGRIPLSLVYNVP